ncbi:MAG: ATP-binding protein [Chlorobiaceae bacterium]
MTYDEIVLPSRYSEYPALYDFINSFSEQEGYSSLFVDDLQLSLKEAFVNAVKHGNQERDGLTVSCSLSAKGKLLFASIKDCGNGFDPDQLLNPVDPRHCLLLSGRGVYIIRAVAEIISFEHCKDGTAMILRYITH